MQDAKKNTPPPYSLVAMNPFRSGSTIEEVIVDAFTGAMDTFSVTIQRLILEAEVTLHNLDTFEEVLAALHGAVAHGDLSIHVDVMRAIGIILGGQKTGPPLSWLNDFGDYQRQAQAHVLAALHILDSMSEDMKDLRERVTVAVEFVDDEIPLHVQIQSIQSGLRRLQIARVRAKASIRKMRKLVHRKR
jgi:hypothetical protein